MGKALLKKQVSRVLNLFAVGGLLMTVSSVSHADKIEKYYVLTDSSYNVIELSRPFKKVVFPNNVHMDASPIFLDDGKTVLIDLSEDMRGKKFVVTFDFGKSSKLVGFKVSEKDSDVRKVKIDIVRGREEIAKGDILESEESLLYENGIKSMIAFSEGAVPDGYIRTKDTRDIDFDYFYASNVSTYKGDGYVLRKYLVSLERFPETETGFLDKVVLSEKLFFVPGVIGVYMEDKVLDSLSKIISVYVVERDDV